MLLPVTTMPELAYRPKLARRASLLARRALPKLYRFATDKAAANVLIDKTIDRHACRLRNSLHDVVWHEGLPGAILKKGRVEDDRAWRQLRELF